MNGNYYIFFFRLVVLLISTCPALPHATLLISFPGYSLMWQPTRTEGVNCTGHMVHNTMGFWAHHQGT